MADELARRLHDELAPHDDAVARMRTVLATDIELTSEPSPAPRRRRRAPVVRLGIALAGAAAIALAIAASPFGSDRDHGGVAAPATAQAALERAADAAGDAEWTPLAAGEYHHTMRTSFTPRIPSRNGDTDRFNDTPPGAPSSTEVFLDVDGRGMRIDVMGWNGDPNSYVTPGKPDRHGRILGFGSDDPDHAVLRGSTADQLRYAATVGVTSWPRSGGRPTYRLWFRTPTGFKTGAAMPGGTVPRPGLDLGQRFQRDQWGAPLDVLDRLNDAAPDERDALLEPLLGEVPDGEIAVVGPLAQGDYDETRAWFAAQVEVQRAVKLLGSAPLAPNVRQALFQRLAQQPHAKVERNVRDERGRAGTRVTFEWLLDEPVPAFDVTLADLRQDAKQHQQEWQGEVEDPGPIHVPAHRSVGRWYQSIVFDERTGALLQQEAYADWRTTKSVPRLAHPAVFKGPRQPPIGVQWDPAWYGTLDATVFDARDRADDLSGVESAACGTTPRMCR